MHYLLTFPHLIAEHYILSYIILFIGIIFEGEIVVIIAGVSAHLGALHVFPTLAVILFGGISKTFIGYYLGIFLKKKFPKSKLLLSAENKVHYFFPRFRNRPFWSIFTSRFFTLGLHFMTLIFSGFTGIHIKKVMKAEFSSLLIWTFGVFSLGYFFSYTAVSVTHDIRKFFIIVLLLIVLFIMLHKLFIFISDLIRDTK